MRATRNQLANTKNSYQGTYKRVLFICSAGLLRSATAAHVFSAPPYNWNTRSAASNSEYGLNVVNEALLYWADEIFVMSDEHIELMKGLDVNVNEYMAKIHVLGIPDNFSYRDDELRNMLKQKVEEFLKTKQ